MLAADEALVVKAGGPTLVRPGLSADIYSGKAVMMKLMGPFDMAGGGGSLRSGRVLFRDPLAKALVVILELHLDVIFFFRLCVIPLHLVRNSQVFLS